MDNSIIRNLTKKWQPSLNNLPVNSYIGDRENRYVTVNQAQASSIISAGLPVNIFIDQTPLDMPAIIDNNNLGMDKRSIRPVWKDIHANNRSVMQAKQKQAFIELWPISLTEVQITYSIKQPILHDQTVIGYMGKSMDIRREKIGIIIDKATDNQSLLWHSHHLIHKKNALLLSEDESRSICFFLTGNAKLLRHSVGQARCSIEILKHKLGFASQIRFIQTLLSGTLLQNLLEILKNENL